MVDAWEYCKKMISLFYIDFILRYTKLDIVIVYIILEEKYILPQNDSNKEGIKIIIKMNRNKNMFVAFEN